MRYVIDIDETICWHPNGVDIYTYLGAEPIQENIDKVNKLYNEGHEIVFLTARGTGSGIDHRKITEQQLAEWNVKYHELYLNKPYGDVYIDDKALNVKDWK